MQRLYVLINENLPPVYGCVQGAHCVAQYMLENPGSEWNNDYLIFLKANLEKMEDKLNHHDVKRTYFNEPDLDGQLTAIAVLNNGNLFKNLRTV